MIELFEPNLEELEVMIKEIEKQMEDAESLAEWKELQHQLEGLLEKQKELLKNKDLADRAFEKYKDYEVTKTAINSVLNQEYL